MSEHGTPERILWEGYSSWGQFSWLYFFSVWTASRGIIFAYGGVSGWVIWIVGAGILLVVVVVLRYWAKYLVTSRQVVIRNGYTGKTIRSVDHEKIDTVEVVQGPFANFLGIGSVVVQCRDPNQTLRLRGVKNPEILATKLRALLPVSAPIVSQSR